MIMSSKKRDYVWNTAAGVINAAEVILLSVVVMRYGKITDAGILSFAFAAGNVFMSVGAFGGRMFQATDINRQYSFKMYIIHRLSSSGLMVLCVAIYILISAFEPIKAKTVAIIAFIYVVEVIENCIWGYLQSRDLLYIGAKMFCTRWITIISLFSLCMVLFKDMVKALQYGAVAGLIVFVAWVIIERDYLKQEAEDNSDKPFDTRRSHWFISLTRNTFPLFVAAFCSLFVNNVPKFAIDQYMNDEIQACYGFVAMPVFVIGLLNQFIYQPTVAKLAGEYCNGEIEDFRCNVKRQVIAVAGIMAACVIGAAIIGIPVLSLIYNTNLSGYWKELVILQFAGGFLALSGYFNVILTIMRKQNVILKGYLMVLITGIAIMYPAVKYAGTIGASIGYLLVMVVLFIYYYFSYERALPDFMDFDADV